MPIKTGRVRRAFDSAIANEIVCPNMLLMTIAFVCYELDYNNLSANKAAQYTRYRDTMCRAAIQNDLTRDQIATAIYTIDKCRFPSEQQTSRLFDLISATYRFVDNDSVIPDSDLIFLNDTEISERKNHIPVKQTKQLHTQQTQPLQSSKEFTELSDYLESEIIPELFRFPMTEPMKKRLQSLETDQFDFSVILKCFQWYKRDIVKAIKSKAPFKTDFDKFCFMCGVAKNYLQETVKNIDDQERQQQKAERFLLEYAERLNHKSAEYQRRTEEPPPGFENYW